MAMKARSLSAIFGGLYFLLLATGYAEGTNAPANHLATNAAALVTVEVPKSPAALTVTPEAPKIALAMPSSAPSRPTNSTAELKSPIQSPALPAEQPALTPSTPSAGTDRPTGANSTAAGDHSTTTNTMLGPPAPASFGGSTTNLAGAGSLSSSPTNSTISPAPSISSAASRTNQAPTPPLDSPAWMVVRASLTSPNLLDTTAPSNTVDPRQNFETQLIIGQHQRLEKNPVMAKQTLVGLLESKAPEDIKQSALLELALVARDENQLLKAQQIYAQFMQRYPDDPRNPAVLLQQGLVYRDMGSYQVSLGKFYAVMTSALRLKLDRIKDYQLLVLRAQCEIADTHFLAAHYPEAADYFFRLLKLEEPALNKTQIHFKLIRTLAFLNKPNEVVAQAQDFLTKYSNTAEHAEVRFLLANALKQLGRNRDALQQVLVLLETQSRSAALNPTNWAYWQQRTGNEIANQLYKEGDYINALEIYLNLAQLDNSVRWQLPLWYQIGLVYEHLRQPQKADEVYGRMLTREKDLGTNAAPSLQAVLDMAKWRRGVLGWDARASSNSQPFRISSALTTNSVIAGGN
jgi:tetratricopeptide (TPR) repeat protein